MKPSVINTYVFTYLFIYIYTCLYVVHGRRYEVFGCGFVNNTILQQLCMFE